MNRREFFVSCAFMTSQPLFSSELPNGSEPEKPLIKKAANIRYQTVRLDLNHPWVIARGGADFKENVFVFYEREGITGFGEAAHLTAAGQTAAQTIAGIVKLVPLYQSSDPWQFDHISQQAKVGHPPAPARAALDMALMDWIGKKLNIPLFRLFGMSSDQTPPTSYSIGLDTLEVMKQKTKEAAGYQIIKVKLGRDEDEEIIKALRLVTDKPIRADANEGWKDREIAIRKIEWLHRYNVELVEQPLPRHLTDDHAWLKSRSPIPIIADEAVQQSEDIAAIAGAYSGINVKIMKAGGILESLRMLQMARAHKMDTMIGCMIESSLGITAAAHLQSLARWIDLDGCLLLKKDPFAGARLVEGRWRLQNDPGLGVKAIMTFNAK